MELATKIFHELANDNRHLHVDIRINWRA
jgi:hypothetical protein